MDAVSLTIGVILVIVGLVLLAIELVHPGALLLIPATILLVAGALYLLDPASLTTTIWGPAVIAVAAVGAAIATIPYYQHIAPIHRPMVTTPSSLQGEEGLVVTEVVPDTIKGKVRIRSEVWSAQASRPIPEGTKVRVVRGEGVTVWVEPVVVGANAS